MMLSAAGSMGAMFLAPRIYRTLGRGTLCVVGLFLCAAFWAPIWASNLVWLSAALLIAGAAVGMLDITSNMRAASIEAAHDMSLMNYVHAMFSYAFGFSALFVAFAREAGWGRRKYCRFCRAWRWFSAY